MTVLFIIGTIILFLGIDWFVQRRRGDHLRESSPLVQNENTYPLRLPEGIFFTKSHTWLNLFPTGKVLFGVDDFVGRLLHNPKIIYLKRSGDRIHKGDPLLLLQSENHTLTVQSPLEGEIIEVNTELALHPELLQEKLFAEGWSYVIKPKGLTQIKEFLLGNETKIWIQDEFRKLRDLVSGMGKQGDYAPAFLQDGGPPVPGLLNTLNDNAWKQFEDNFLQVK